MYFSINFWFCSQHRFSVFLTSTIEACSKKIELILFVTSEVSEDAVNPHSLEALEGFLRDIGIQCFLNFGDICHIYLRDMGYFFKTIKGIWDTGTSSQGLSLIRYSWSVLAHRIRIPDILSWVGKSYLNHTSLPRLSPEVCTLVVLEHMRMVVEGRQCPVKVTSCDNASQRIRGLLEAYFITNSQWWTRKKSIICVWVG